MCCSPPVENLARHRTNPLGFLSNENWHSRHHRTAGCEAAAEIRSARGSLNWCPTRCGARMELVLSWFHDRTAEGVTAQDIDRRLEQTARERNWEPATCNRFKSLVSLCYSLGI